MMKIKDDSGHVLSGIYKDDRGYIVVKNDSEYNKHLRSVQQQETINKLSQEVSELKELMSNLISTIKSTKE